MPNSPRILLGLPDGQLRPVAWRRKGFEGRHLDHFEDCIGGFLFLCDSQRLASVPLLQYQVTTVISSTSLTVPIQRSGVFGPR